ncbi:MAG: GNAT family N-acetyltransferase [Kangiellaceae bacterium]|nr:GNAT family N-acetyltransferase [Kangiellaceae bacterium]
MLIKGQVTGYIWAEHIRHKKSPLTYSSSTLYIHHISVSEAYLRNEVGASLMKRVEELTNSMKVDYVALNVWSFNSEAKEFFRENEFSGYNQKMWKWHKN